MKYRVQILSESLLSIFLVIFFSTFISAQITSTLRSITIITEPNATVWIDDMRFGATDDKGRLKIASVPAGIRTLRVRAQGFTEVRRSLPATLKGDVNVALTRTTDEAELAYQAAEAATAVDRQKAISEYQRAIKLRGQEFPLVLLTSFIRVESCVENQQEECGFLRIASYSED